VIEDSELDVLELDTHEKKEDVFSAGRLFSVALAGAIASLGAYYIYHQLDPDKKARLKEQASGMIAEQIHALTEVRDDD
jgi:hypothetical protein